MKGISIRLPVFWHICCRHDDNNPCHKPSKRFIYSPKHQVVHTSRKLLNSLPNYNCRLQSKSRNTNWEFGTNLVTMCLHCKDHPRTVTKNSQRLTPEWTCEKKYIKLRRKIREWKICYKLQILRSLTQNKLIPQTLSYNLKEGKIPIYSKHLCLQIRENCPSDAKENLHK